MDRDDLLERLTALTEVDFEAVIFSLQAGKDLPRDGTAQKLRAIKLVEWAESRHRVAELTALLDPKVPPPKSPDGFQRFPSARRCFGRDAELQTLLTALSQSPLPFALPVLGTGGIGKSNLCLNALPHAQVKQRFGPRRAFVRCDAAKDCESLMKELAQAIRVEVGPNLEDRLFQKLETAPALVVLDNLETPWEHAQEATEEFLTLLANVETVALIGSIRGFEKPHHVPWHDPIRLVPLQMEPARDIFLAIAGKHLSADPRLTSLLKALDGLPLAVELMARQAEGESDLERLEARWQAKRTNLLAYGKGKDRLSSLAVSVELSFDSLRVTSVAREVLTLLGVLPNGLAHCDMKAIFGVDLGNEAAAVLCKVGLTLDNDHRVRVLAPVREHLAVHHPPEENLLIQAMLLYTRLGEEGNKLGAAGGQEATARLLPEIENIEAMIGWALDSGNRQPGYDGALGLGKFFQVTGFGTPKILEAAVSTADRHQEVRQQANCIQSLGDIALARSDHEGARACYEQALPLFVQVGDVQGQANCIRSLGDIALRRSDHEGARARYEQALPLYEQVGDVLGQATCIKNLGNIALRRSDHEGARACYEQALPLYVQVGSVLGQANCIKSLGDIALDRSDHEGARACYEQALPLYEQVGDVLGQANCILSLGDIVLEQSDHDAARSRFETALELYQRIPEPYSIGWAHRYLARLFPAGAARESHVTAARAAWVSIDRPDLVQELDDEFGSQG